MAHSDKKMLSIFLTNTCNLDCVYCYAHNDPENIQIMSKDFAFWGIEYYYKEYILKHGFDKRIRFYGPGEPTTQFTLMRDISEYAKKIWGIDTQIEIQTNGCFSDMVCEWIEENADNIWISCDGLPEIQNRNRPFYITHKPSSPVMERNIKKLALSDKCVVGIRSTITELNVDEQIDNVKYFHSLGVKYVWVDTVFPGVGDDVRDFVYLDMNHFVDKFLEATKYADSLNMEYRTFFACNFDKCTNMHCRACYPVPHLTTDGYLSACDMALFGESDSRMKELIYGKWDANTKKVKYFDDRIKKIQDRRVENLAHCKHCSANQHCGGYCLGETLNETGSLFGHKAVVCNAIRRLYKELPDELKKYTYKHP